MSELVPQPEGIAVSEEGYDKEAILDISPEYRHSGTGTLSSLLIHSIDNDYYDF